MVFVNVCEKSFMFTRITLENCNMHYRIYLNKLSEKCAGNNGLLCSQTNRLSFVAVVVSPGVAPHCLDPGTVHSVTVQKFDGEKWEESMKAHKSIRGMSKPVAEPRETE